MMSSFDRCGTVAPQTVAGAVTVVVYDDGKLVADSPQTVRKTITDETDGVIDIEVGEVGEVFADVGDVELMGGIDGTGSTVWVDVIVIVP